MLTLRAEFKAETTEPSKRSILGPFPGAGEVKIKKQQQREALREKFIAEKALRDSMSGLFPDPAGLLDLADRSRRSYTYLLTAEFIHKIK